MKREHLEMFVVMATATPVLVAALFTLFGGMQ